MEIFLTTMTKKPMYYKLLGRRAENFMSPAGSGNGDNMKSVFIY